MRIIARFKSYLGLFCLIVSAGAASAQQNVDSGNGEARIVIERFEKQHSITGWPGLNSCGDADENTRALNATQTYAIRLQVGDLTRFGASNPATGRLSSDGALHCKGISLGVSVYLTGWPQGMDDGIYIVALTDALVERTNDYHGVIAVYAKLAAIMRLTPLDPQNVISDKNIMEITRERVCRGVGDCGRFTHAEKLQLRPQESAETTFDEESLLWRKTTFATDSVSLQRYLDRYPIGLHAAEVSVKLASIRLAEDTQRKGFQDCPECPEMLIIPAGKFNFLDKGKLHTSLNSFAIGKTEVTQRQWRTIMGNNPSKFKNCGDYCPVEQVNWDDAKDFVSRLSLKTGKTYRLPSEAEWIYACRANRFSLFCGGDNDVLWAKHNSGETTHPGATKQANAWGVYDMSGNVWEWTQDCWNEPTRIMQIDGSAIKTGDCVQRVICGGSWDDEALRVSTSICSRSLTTNRDSDSGIRVVRTLP